MLNNNSIISWRQTASRYLLLILLFFIINSCLKEDFNVSKIDVKNYTPGLAFPLINANLDLNDIAAIDSSGWNLREDATKFMTLFYDKSASFEADSFLKISSQQLLRNEVFNVDNSLPVGDSTFDSYASFLDFTSSDNDIFDLMLIKKGTITVKINSDLNMRGTMVFRLPDVTKAGNMLTRKFNYWGHDTVLNIDLDGYLITFSHIGNLNRLSTEYDVTAYNDGLPNFSPYFVNFDIKLENIKFSYVYGYFSSRNFDFIDQLKLSLFAGIESGDSYFENPKLHLDFTNSVGIPVNLNIQTLIAHSGLKAPYDINITGLPNPISIASPPSPGTFVKVNYLLDKSNSNIKDAINIVPSAFKYDVKGVTAPDAVHQNFIFDTSKIKLDVEVEIPLYGRIKDYYLTDTFPFTLDNMDLFESLTFNLLLANGFPMESSVQLYFLDENNNMLDSLFVLPRDNVRSALVDITTGKVTKAVSHLYTVVFDRKRLDKIINCKKMKVRASLNTSLLGQYSVKIYSNYAIDIKLSALAKLKN
jgi:hypothetical protein